MKRDLSEINKIIVHCSASSFGDLKLIDQWHRDRGWKGCGYHYVITNGVPTFGKPYCKEMDGKIQHGRPLEEVGAHCKGHNHDSIGVCLIGDHHFTAAQLYQALPTVVFNFGRLGLTWENVYGHCEFNSLKACPTIDPEILRPGIYSRLRKKK